jgi:hypothetical protein
VEVFNNNLRRIVMIFPVHKNRVWYWNSLIDVSMAESYHDKWEYVYSSVDQLFEIDSFAFDSVTIVRLVDKVNLIEKDYFYEYYAKNVGLVYQLSTHLTKQNINDEWDKGFIVVKKIINYSRR